MHALCECPGFAAVRKRFCSSIALQTNCSNPCSADYLCSPVIAAARSFSGELARFDSTSAPISGPCSDSFLLMAHLAVCLSRRALLLFSLDEAGFARLLGLLPLYYDFTFFWVIRKRGCVLILVSFFQPCCSRFSSSLASRNVHSSNVAAFSFDLC